MKNRPIRRMKYTVSEPTELVKTIHGLVTEVMAEVMKDAFEGEVVPLKVFLAIQRKNPHIIAIGDLEGSPKYTTEEQ